MTETRPGRPSLWIATTPDTAFPPLQHDATVGVCVVGGGITGLTAAYLLATAGIDVTVLERWQIAGGTTGHTTAKVTLLQGLAYQAIAKHLGADAARDYAEANRAAQNRLARIIAEERIACDLQRLPAYTWTEDPGLVDDVRAEVGGARDAGLDASFDDTTPLPWRTLGAVRLDDQIAFHPRRYCLGIAERIIAVGGTIHEGTAAREVKDDGDGVRVITETGTVHARSVIIATLLPFHDPALLGARTQPSRSYALAARIEGTLPQGLLLSAEKPHRSVRPHQPTDGPGHLIVEGEEHVPGAESQVTRHHVELEAWTRDHFPVVAIDYSWSAQDYMTPDGLPFIGRVTPTSDRVLVATGFNKWGMTNGTLAGMMLAELAQGHEPAWSERFSATRLGATGNIGQLLKQTAEVGKAFLTGRLPGGRQLADIAPGSAAVIDGGGGKIAVSRDLDGTFRGLSARCTHMGCIVAFNDAERSWDCPCHGSRFDLTGRVLEGPAGGPLEPVEVGE